MNCKIHFTSTFLFYITHNHAVILNISSIYLQTIIINFTLLQTMKTDSQLKKFPKTWKLSETLLQWFMVNCCKHLVFQETESVDRYLPSEQVQIPWTAEHIITPSTDFQLKWRRTLPPRDFPTFVSYRFQWANTCLLFSTTNDNYHYLNYQHRLNNLDYFCCLKFGFCCLILLIADTVLLDSFKVTVRSSWYNQAHRATPSLSFNNKTLDHLRLTLLDWGNLGVLWNQAQYRHHWLEENYTEWYESVRLVFFMIPV